MSVHRIFSILSKIYGKAPMEMAFAHDHFQFLVAVMLSARSRDSMTIPIAQRLFAFAPKPAKILELPVLQIEHILRPIGFYHVKTVYLRGLVLKVLRDF